MSILELCSWLCNAEILASPSPTSLHLVLENGLFVLEGECGTLVFRRLVSRARLCFKARTKVRSNPRVVFCTEDMVELHFIQELPYCHQGHQEGKGR